MTGQSNSQNHIKSKVTLDQLLSLDMINVGVCANDWRSAIIHAGNLLIKSGAVRNNYVLAMLSVAENLGPYIVIAPGIAMPHARPEDGVINTAICVVCLEHPVNFGHPENDPVKLIIGLAAVDHEQHINVMSQLATILDTPEIVKQLMQASSSDQFRETILNALSGHH